MSPPEARLAFLRAELARDWALVREHAANAASVDPGRGAPEAAYVALSLDHAYQAFETFLVRLERGLGLPERAGPSWHSEILHDAGLSVPGLRPAVYPEEARRGWAKLLGFRHFLRHAYAVRLDPDELRTNRLNLEQASTMTERHVAALLGALG